MKELPEKRSENARVFQLSDGRLEAAVSAGPSNFRDGAGKWQPIDTRVTGVKYPGFVVGNETNSYQSPESVWVEANEEFRPCIQPTDV